jgi:hypothetical protein
MKILGEDPIFSQDRSFPVIVKRCSLAEFGSGGILAEIARIFFVKVNLSLPEEGGVCHYGGINLQPLLETSVL